MIRKPVFVRRPFVLFTLLLAGAPVFSALPACAGGNRRAAPPLFSSDSTITKVFVVPSTACFFVNGHRIEGTATVTWTAGDTLRINDIPVSPPRADYFPHDPPDTMAHREWNKDVPYVQKLLATGVGIEKAVEAYNAQRKIVMNRFLQTYQSILEKTGRRETAAEAARRELHSPDLVLELAREPEIGESSARIQFAGKAPFWVDLNGKWEPAPPPTQAVIRNFALMITAGLQQYLKEDPPKGIYFVSPSGVSSLGKTCEQLREQVEKARAGHPGPGPVSSNALKLLVKYWKE